MAEVLSERALNRATLARQLLLTRHDILPFEAVHHLFAMQAQQAKPPYIGLWTRLERFQPDFLNLPLRSLEIVRVTSLRCTLHLMTARDYLEFRSTIRPVLDGAMDSIVKAIAKQRGGTLPELGPLVAEAHRAFEEQPRTFEAMRTHLLTVFPGADERAMGYAVRTQLPLLQVPTETRWGFPAHADFTTTKAWLGHQPDTEVRLQELVRRYLAAFGPASVADMQKWSGLGGLKRTFEAMRPELTVFRDARKRELFDLPDAPRPSEDTPAPVRFLPDFDNLVLGHDDRTRVIADAYRPRVVTKNLQVLATFLLDGFVAGTWKITATKTKARLVMTPFEDIGAEKREQLVAEAERLVRFAEPDVKAYVVEFA